MPIASSVRWTALTVEQLKLNQKPGAGDDWPHFLPAYKQRLIGKRY
jgi:hypothetical protein